MSIFISNGDSFKWRVKACNEGPDSTTNVVAVITLPSGVTSAEYTVTQGTYDPSTSTWTAGTVEASSCATLEIRMTVTDSTLAPFTASATITGDQIDPVMIDNLDTDIVGDSCSDVVNCIQFQNGDGINMSGDGTSNTPYQFSFNPVGITPTQWANFITLFTLNLNNENRYVQTFIQSDFVAAEIEILQTVHTKGLNPIVQVLQQDGLTYTKSEIANLTVRTRDTGDVVIEILAGSEFDGKIIIM